MLSAVTAVIQGTGNKKRLNAHICALRRNSRGATQLCFRVGKHALPHTDDMRRLDNGGGARRCLLVSFRSALRSPFASSARTAVPLSAVPFAVPRGCYSSPSQVSLRKKHTILFSPCQAVNLYFDCFLAGSDKSPVQSLSTRKMPHFRYWVSGAAGRMG